MARFRLFDPVPQWRDALGDLIGTGGTLSFFDTGTTTPRVVYNAITGGASLGSTLTIDADGRLSEDFYLDGEYRVILKTAADVTVWQRDNVLDVASGGLTIPDAADGDDGDVLKTDGTSGGFYWEASESLPSQTGNAGKYLQTDGESTSWVTIAEAVAPDVEATPGTTGSYVIDGVMTQWGTDTAPTAAGITTSKAVTFGTVFGGTAYTVEVCPVLSAGVTNNSPPDWPTWAHSSKTDTGCTVSFFCGGENNAGTIAITSTIPFTWKATGPAPA